MINYSQICPKDTIIAKAKQIELHAINLNLSPKESFLFIVEHKIGLVTFLITLPVRPW